MKNKCITIKDKAMQLVTGEKDDAILRRKFLQCPGHDHKDPLDWFCNAVDYNKFFSTYRLSASDTFVPLKETASCAGHFWFRDLGKIQNLKDCIAKLLSTYKIPDALKTHYVERFSNTIEQFEAGQSNKKAANVMLQMTIPKQLLDQASYTSLPGGLKRDVYKRSEFGEVVRLTKTSEYLDQKSKNPFALVDKKNNDYNGGVQNMEYRLILGDDLLLNSKATEERFKVYPYTRDSVHLLKFHEEMNDILSHLERDMSKLN